MVSSPWRSLARLKWHFILVAGALWLAFAAVSPWFMETVRNHYHAFAIAELVGIFVLAALNAGEFRKSFGNVGWKAWLCVLLITALAFYLRHGMFVLGGVGNVYMEPAISSGWASSVDITSYLPNYNTLLSAASLFGEPGLPWVQDFSLLLKSMTCVDIFCLVYLITMSRKAALFGSLLACLATMSIFNEIAHALDASFFFLSLSALLFFMSAKGAPRMCALFLLVLAFTFGLELENMLLLAPIGMLYIMHKPDTKTLATHAVILMVLISPLAVWYSRSGQLFSCAGHSCEWWASNTYPELEGRSPIFGTLYPELARRNIPVAMSAIASFPHFFDEFSPIKLGTPLIASPEHGMSNISFLFLALAIIGAVSMRRPGIFFGVWIGAFALLYSLAWQRGPFSADSVIGYYPALITLTSIGAWKASGRIRDIKARWREWELPLENASWAGICIVTIAFAFTPSMYLNPTHTGDFPYFEMVASSGRIPQSSIIILSDDDRYFFIGKRAYWTEEYVDGNMWSFISNEKRYYLEYPTDCGECIKKPAVEKRFILSPAFEEGAIMAYEIIPRNASDDAMAETG